MLAGVSSTVVAGTSAVVVGSTAFGIFTKCIFRVAKPSQYLVQTGLGIKDPMGMRVSKTAFVWPLVRRLQVVNMNPRNVDFILHCLSKEYLPFNIPVTYSLSPFDPSDPNQTETTLNVQREVTAEELFKRYVQKMEQLSPKEFESVVLGVVHGTTRILAAGMPIDSINDSRDAFNSEIVAGVQNLLLQFGLRVQNANIAELTEQKRPNGERGYLEARERKKLSEAVQQSEVFVAEATKEGDIGKKQREAFTRQENSRLEAATRMIESETQQQIASAQADLGVANVTSKRREEISQIEADAAAAQRREELQLKIEMLREEQLLIAKRAEKLTTNKVNGECRQIDARAQAEAVITEATAHAQALKITAEAIRFEGDQKAAVIFANLEAEAKGKQALWTAQADTTKALVLACGGNAELASSVLSMYNNIPQAIAKANADAVQGLKPQIYSMGGESAGVQIASIIAALKPALEMFNTNRQQLQ